jgi:hypothetical protein
VSGTAELQSWMATDHDNAGMAAQSLATCGDKRTVRPARYQWTVSGQQLHLRFVSGDPCHALNQLLTSQWTKQP